MIQMKDIIIKEAIPNDVPFSTGQDAFFYLNDSHSL